VACFNFIFFIFIKSINEQGRRFCHFILHVNIIRQSTLLGS
jgi:hypothetical protein